MLKIELEKFLEKACNDTQDINCIYEAMRYSLLSGGKRIRGLLVLEFCKMFNANLENAMPFAAAIEMIHTYSLIHDDLPCMDNDDLRRGKPTNHKVFGENIAVLSGDGLLNLAFETMLACENSDKAFLAIREIAKASGSRGMIAGQAMDIFYEGKDIDIKELKKLQALKTGELIRVSCYVGTILSTNDTKHIKNANDFGIYLGRAFQIIDDILDIEGDEKVLGKPIGRDVYLEKSTYPSIIGLENSKKIAIDYTEKALEILETFPNNQDIKKMTMALLKRNI